ncbi:hypothetical protein F963_03586, partial [Acinetobacter bereziniae NIPH 3]
NDPNAIQDIAGNDAATLPPMQQHYHQLQ